MYLVNSSKSSVHLPSNTSVGVATGRVRHVGHPRAPRQEAEEARRRPRVRHLFWCALFNSVSMRSVHSVCHLRPLLYYLTLVVYVLFSTAHACVCGWATLPHSAGDTLVYCATTLRVQKVRPLLRRVARGFLATSSYPQLAPYAPPPLGCYVVRPASRLCCGCKP